MRNLNSQELLARTKNLVAEERKLTISLIEHLEEIQRRMLFTEMGYASLWEFVTQELGLSEGSAQRRIQAMRLIRDLPEAKSALADGKLSLSNAAKVQSFRQAERKLGRKTDAQALVTAVAHLSQRECEKKLFEISPEALPRERERTVSAEGERELKIVVSAGLYEKLQRLKGLLAHARPNASYAELLEYATDQALGQLEKKKGITRSDVHLAVAPAAIASTAAAGVNARDAAVGAVVDSRGAAVAVNIRVVGQVSLFQGSSPEYPAAQPPLPAGKRVYLPVALSRPIWARSRGQCEIVHEGRRCISKFRLELDHITPLALGGANTAANLRIVCAQHHRRFTFQEFGENTKYFKSR